MSRFCFIVVNYFGADDTLAMFKSLVASSSDEVDFEFLVVDNSVCEKEYQRLIIMFDDEPNVRLLKAGRNLGYFNGINFGISNVNLGDYDSVVVSNNDLEFDIDFLSGLSDVCSTYPSHVYAICPDIVTLDGVHQNPHVKRRYGLFSKLKLDLLYSNYYISKIIFHVKSFLGANQGSEGDEGAQEVHLGFGAIYILTPAFFKNNSELNYPFFMYGEEAFLSHQIHETGGSLFFDPRLRVIHKFSASTSKIPSKDKFCWAKESYKVHRKYL